MARCSSPLASARSVPGSGARCSEAPPAVAVRRGSTTTWVAPALGRRRRTAWPAAWWPPGSSRPAARPRPRRCRERERQPAVDAERPVGRGGRGRHAEAAVVVDHRGAERDPGELAERVRLLVGQSAAAEAADAVAAVPDCRSRIRVDDQPQRLVPRRRSEGAGPVAGHGADQRRQQPLRMVEQVSPSSPSSTARRGWSGSPAAAAAWPGVRRR